MQEFVENRGLHCAVPQYLLRHHGHRTFDRRHESTDHVFSEQLWAMSHKAAHGCRGKRQKVLVQSFKNLQYDCAFHIVYACSPSQMVQCCSLTLYQCKKNLFAPAYSSYCEEGSTFLTTQGSSSSLQGDLPGEVIPSGLLRLQLLLGTREHVPPEQQHLWQVVAHEGGAWAIKQGCGVCAVSKGSAFAKTEIFFKKTCDKM